MLCLWCGDAEATRGDWCSRTCYCLALKARKRYGAEGGCCWTAPRNCCVCSKLFFAGNPATKLCSYACKRTHEKAYRRTHGASWRRTERAIELKWDRHLSRTYGISLAEYRSMLEAQGGVCSLCGASPTKGRRLAVDHCHATGRVRSLLCASCNVGLGMLRDDPDLIDRAAAYIRRHAASD